MSTAGGLDVFRDPAAVTVVGASADPAKWGWWLATGALRGAHRRPVHLVNRRGGEVDGRPVVASLDEIEGPLGLVALSVPPAGVPDVVARALEHGATGFLGITAGIDRALDDPAAERRLAASIREAGARLVGPNCLGLYDAATDLQLAWGRFRAGRLAIVSQSGQVGSELANLAAARGLGVSRFVSLGNQVDVTAAEVVADLAGHEATTVVALYLEGFGDGRTLLEALTRLADAGLPVLLLTVGASSASRTAAASHTGAMTSDLDIVDAACRVAGAVRVATPQQLVDAAVHLAGRGRTGGARIGVLSDSGGQGALAADVLTSAGLAVPPLTLPTQQAVSVSLPDDAACANPIDLAGAGERDLATYAEVTAGLADDDGVDAVLLSGYFGSYAELTPALADHEREIADLLAATVVRTDKPVVVHSMASANPVLERLAGAGIATYPTVEAAAGALGAAARRRPVRRLTRSIAALDGPDGSGYWSARTWLADHGVRFPAATLTDGSTPLFAGPYVLKADWIAHKTEHDAVRVGLDADALTAAYAEMRGRLGERLNGRRFVVEAQDRRDHVVELVVAARRDPAFGPVVAVGAGGVVAELVRDVELELAPLDRATARSAIDRLTVSRLLAGWRGRPAVDVDAVADLLVALGDLIAAAPADITEIELNPVRVAPDGLVAVDALVVRAEEGVS